MSENKIVCRRTGGTWQVNDVVILKAETNYTHTGRITRKCDEPGYVEVMWLHKNADIFKVKTANLMHFDEWKAAREQQAKLKNYWK